MTDPAHRNRLGEEKTTEEEARHSTAAGQWSSEELTDLGNRLVRDLGHLADSEFPADQQDLVLRQVEAGLQRAQTLAWRAVASGDFEAPRRALDMLLGLQPFADAHAPELSRPEQAALALQSALEAFYTADEALAKERNRVRLADTRRSAGERDVLRVLAASEEPLRRGEVHNRLDPKQRPTPARISQILTDLFDDGLLRRIPGPAQGNRQTSFYELSGRGQALVERLGLDLSAPQEAAHDVEEVSAERSAEQALRRAMAQIAHGLIDDRLDWKWRSVAAGLLASLAPEHSSEAARHQLEHWLRSKFPHDTITKTYLENIKNTYQLRLLARERELQRPEERQELLLDLMTMIHRILDAPASREDSPGVDALRGEGGYEQSSREPGGPEGTRSARES